LRRNCLLKHVIEGKIEGIIEVTGRRGRRRKQPLDDLKEKREFCKLKEEALARAPCRTGSERGYGTVGRRQISVLEKKMLLRIILSTLY
jgi:hypothetical protein